MKEDDKWYEVRTALFLVLVALACYIIAQIK